MSIIGASAYESFRASVRDRVGASAVNVIQTDLSEAEAVLVRTYTRRIWAYFEKEHPRGQMMCSVPVDGCGIVDAGEADVLVDGTLYDIKITDKPFLSVDYRQLLTYAALLWSSNSVVPQKVGLVNPRLGTYSVIATESLCQQCAGISATELFNEVVREVTRDDFA